MCWGGLDPAWVGAWARGDSRARLVSLATLCHGPGAARVSPGPCRVWGLGLRCGLSSTSVLARLGSEGSQLTGPRYGPHFQGEFPSPKGNPGKIQCCCWQHQSPRRVSAEPPEFSGIRCLHTKLSRCGCVGWAETFLCRSNMQLMPMIEDLA